MANASKVKGRAFEYVIRDLFTEAFNEKFERVPLSGALAYLKGDVYCPNLPKFPWCIEAKNHKVVDWNNVLTAKSSQLIAFWQQAVREAAVMKKDPLLIYKWDRSKIYVCWNDSIRVENFVFISSGESRFNMALLDHWLPQAKLHLKNNLHIAS
jgi:hypothetical protein